MVSLLKLFPWVTKQSCRVNPPVYWFMIPRKPNLLITQLSDKRLRCPANTSSRAGKVEGSRKMPSRGRLSLIWGVPLFSALRGATKQWIIPSGSSTRLGRRTERCSPLLCSLPGCIKSQISWNLSPHFLEQMGGRHPTAASGNLALFCLITA